MIGAFDKRTIIELSGDVIREIAKKYENVQKGVWNSNMNHALFCVYKYIETNFLKNPILLFTK